MNEIFTRKSVRQFEAREIEPEKFQSILRAGFSTPSALNQRPWEFFVVTNKETLLKLSKCSPYAGTVAKAPAAIVICYRNNIKATDFAHIDCAVAAENILLELESLNLGGVFLQSRRFRKEFKPLSKCFLCLKILSRLISFRLAIRKISAYLKTVLTILAFITFNKIELCTYRRQ